MTRAGVTCVLADDHPPILDSLSRFLADAGYEVVATAHDGAQALEAIVKHRPSVCVADVRMPRLDGLDLVREIGRRVPGTALVLYSGFADRGLVFDALAAGVRGFALKDAPLSDLVKAIDVVAGGGMYVDPVLGAELARADPKARLLSRRERDVLRLLADGSSYGEIGATLFLSPDTVRAHTHHAMAKLGAKTRTQAVARALRDALIA